MSDRSQHGLSTLCDVSLGSYLLLGWSSRWCPLGPNWPEAWVGKMPWAGEEVEVYYPWLGDRQIQTPLVGTLAPPPLFRTLSPFLLPLFVLERAENSAWAASRTRSRGHWSSSPDGRVGMEKYSQPPAHFLSNLKGLLGAPCGHGEATEYQNPGITLELRAFRQCDSEPQTLRTTDLGWKVCGETQSQKTS